VTQLGNIGISTRADASTGFSANKLRGYLEVDVKKLDLALAERPAEVRNLFGHDSDGDLIVDRGVAYQLDQGLRPYTQRNGILALRSTTMNSHITDSEAKIRRLEGQLDTKEADLRQKYSQMEAVLNSLETQSNALDNFSRPQGNR
jgi:flagellar hook-associated protein 2